MIFIRVSKNFLRRTKVKRKSKPENHHPDMWSLTVSDRSDLPSDVDIFELDVWEVSDALTDLLLKKHKDYGPRNISMSPGGALNGLRVRIWDKVARINNLLDSGAKPQNESLEDSFKDLANYSIIALMVLKGKWPKE